MGRDDARKMRSVARILFLAANPAQVPLLQLDEECRGIEQVLARSTHRDQLGFQACRGVRVDDVVQVLNDVEATVVHFSGHAHGAEGVCMVADNGAALLVSTEDLDEIMQAAGASLVLVVLNACYTEVQARVLASRVPCVIGTSEAIADDAAIEYSRYLYRALASGRSVANAHQQAAAALRRAQPSGRQRDITATEVAPCVAIAKLVTRPDVDPDHIYIAGPRARASRSRPRPLRSPTRQRG